MCNWFESNKFKNYEQLIALAAPASISFITPGDYYLLDVEPAQWQLPNDRASPTNSVERSSELRDSIAPNLEPVLSKRIEDFAHERCWCQTGIFTDPLPIAAPPTKSLQQPEPQCYGIPSCLTSVRWADDPPTVAVIQPAETRSIPLTRLPAYHETASPPSAPLPNS